MHSEAFFAGPGPEAWILGHLESSPVEFGLVLCTSLGPSTRSRRHYEGPYVHLDQRLTNDGEGARLFTFT